MEKFYNIYVWRGVEAKLLGPYDNDEQRLEGTLDLWRNGASWQYDSVFRLDVDAEGNPEVSCYASYELEGALEAEEQACEDESLVSPSSSQRNGD